MSKSKSKLLPTVALALLLSVSAVDRTHAANLAGVQQTVNDPFVNFLANQLGLGGILNFFSDSLTQVSNFMTTLTATNTNIPKDITIGVDGLQIGEEADLKLDGMTDTASTNNIYAVPDIDGIKSKYYSSQAEALGRYRSSAEGQKDAVSNAKVIGSATDKSASAVTDSDAAQSTFERTNQLNKNINGLTTVTAMNAKLTLENNRLQSLSVAANAAAQKRAALKDSNESQDRRIQSMVAEDTNAATVFSGPAFIDPDIKNKPEPVAEPE